MLIYVYMYMFIYVYVCTIILFAKHTCAGYVRLYGEYIFSEYIFANLLLDILYMHSVLRKYVHMVLRATWRPQQHLASQQQIGANLPRSPQ